VCVDVDLGGLYVSVPAGWRPAGGAGEFSGASLSLVEAPGGNGVVLSTFSAHDPDGDCATALADTESTICHQVAHCDVVERELLEVAGRPGFRLLLDHATSERGCCVSQLWGLLDDDVSWLLAFTVPSLSFPAAQSTICAVVDSAVPVGDRP
jgi:hypothetical protein